MTQACGHRLEPTAAPHQQSGPGVRREKKALEDTRDGLAAGDHFSYADEFNLRWFPTLRAMWSPKGQQVMLPTPAPPTKHYGLGAVD
ncbi:MAG TPA: hypothetical protein VGP82_13645 [Ktedonobacterales bacterium]|nr:hypothetical protein [Ktedonobacterales bacterium]